MLNIIEKINNLIKEIEIKKGLSWAEARAYPSEIKNRLEMIMTEFWKENGEINKKMEQSQKEITDLKLQLKLEREKLEKIESDKTRLEKEKNNQNKELETAQKKVNDLLIEINPLRVIEIEEAKTIMSEYLEFARKEEKNWKELVSMSTRTREKIENGEKQKKWEARVIQVQEVIEKLNTSLNQQLTTQVEVKK
ncbi:MAG: hypothetical protein I3273_03730 [Candidatus Moeniiplasma glomeromycotorum]|nr:hypothetical protein [Candidatus Moeniiplasma glomeromycotorum]MCE8167959.1 hypothetical protein [Candidatus Moeniiplasma glomeromycotorum]MCE8169206.1 hypothetical protein [Candidatus Moeniiplasma glomeromycotorum]